HNPAVPPTKWIQETHLGGPAARERDAPAAWGAATGDLKRAAGNHCTADDPAGTDDFVAAAADRRPAVGAAGKYSFKSAAGDNRAKCLPEGRHNFVPPVQHRGARRGASTVDDLRTPARNRRSKGRTSVDKLEAAIQHDGAVRSTKVVELDAPARNRCAKGIANRHAIGLRDAFCATIQQRRARRKAKIDAQTASARDRSTAGRTTAVDKQSTTAQHCGTAHRCAFKSLETAACYYGVHLQAIVSLKTSARDRGTHRRGAELDGHAAEVERAV